MPWFDEQQQSPTNHHFSFGTQPLGVQQQPAGVEQQQHKQQQSSADRREAGMRHTAAPEEQPPGAKLLNQLLLENLAQPGPVPLSLSGGAHLHSGHVQGTMVTGAKSPQQGACFKSPPLVRRSSPVQGMFKRVPERAEEKMHRRRLDDLLNSMPASRGEICNVLNYGIDQHVVGRLCNPTHAVVGQHCLLAVKLGLACTPPVHSYVQPCLITLYERVTCACVIVNLLLLVQRLVPGRSHINDLVPRQQTADITAASKQLHLSQMLMVLGPHRQQQLQPCAGHSTKAAGTHHMMQGTIHLEA